LKYQTFRRWWWLAATVFALLSALLFTPTYADDPIATTDAPPANDPAIAIAPIPTPNAPTGEMQIQLFQRINAIRAEHGLPPFQYNLKLENAAQSHVTDMQSHGLRSHRGSNGSTYYDRMVAAGYTPTERWGAANETIGWGNNLDRQISWWMNSAVHRSIILSSHYTEIGIGYTGDPAQRWGHWWVVNYAVPQ
jgi:uncharacterized protein YkwD